jgi:hypothetical protein
MSAGLCGCTGYDYHRMLVRVPVHGMQGPLEKQMLEQIMLSPPEIFFRSMRHVILVNNPSLQHCVSNTFVPTQ